MDFKVGQKVSYPNHGVCAVESISKKTVDGAAVEYYSLRVMANCSHIIVPRANLESVGIRPLIDSSQCAALLKKLAEDFDAVSNDWKVRSREFVAKFQTGCVFAAAEVLKKLTYLNQFKPLSFREQRMLEKARFLVVSELAAACAEAHCNIEKKVDGRLRRACGSHCQEKARVAHAGH